MIEILVVDDHSVVREGLKKIAAQTSDIVVTGEATNGQEALDEALQNHYDVVVLDISMPGKSGLQTLKELKERRPDLPVLVLSIYPEEQYALPVLKAGASGYISKNCPQDELVRALQKVALGGKYVSSSLAEEVALDFETGMARTLRESLSNREFQVMCMLASGETVKEIAGELLLSVKTISTYRSRILRKMNLKNNAELTLYAVRHQLIL